MRHAKRHTQSIRKTITWLFLLCCSLHLTGCDDLGKRINQWFPKPSADDTALHQRTKDGQRLFRAGKFDDALQLFLNLQSQHPQRLDLMYNLGATHLRLGEGAKGDKRKSHFKKAESYLSSVLTKGSAKLRQKAHYNLGMLYTRKRQYEKALYHFEQSDYIARKVLKRADKDASTNRDLLATLLRQRNRRRQKLNRTRVFRYDAKVIKLRASRSYKDPIRKIALKATFTHQGTGTKQVVWGYPTSTRRWEVRFIPTRTGKWRYKIKTIKQRIDAIVTGTKTGPGKRGRISYAQTNIDRMLRDEGLFRVMPSARAGKLVIAKANPSKFAWKKPKSELKLKQKAKANKAKAKAKQPKQQMGPQRPNATKGKAKGKKKRPALPKDEKIIRWHGIELAGLFDAKKTKGKAFQSQVQLLQVFAPTAIHVPVHIDDLIQWPKNAKAAPKLNVSQLLALGSRLKQLRANPTSNYALVYNLRSKRKLSYVQLQTALRFLCAKLGHIDSIWSTTHLSEKLAKDAARLLQRLDPYKQPIASKTLPEILKAQLATQRRIIQKRRTIMRQYARKAIASLKAQKATSKPAKGKAPNKTTPKLPKKPKLPPIPKLNNTRFVLHGSHHVATAPKQLQTKLITPWIAELPIFVGLDEKGLLKLWWQLYISGLNPTISLARTLHKDERKDILDWLRKAEASSKLPPHPDKVAAQKKHKKTTKAAKGTKAAKAKPTAPRLAKTKGTATKGKKAKPNKARPAARKVAKQTKPKAKRTPKDKRLSRPLIHFLAVRHHWFTFLNSFRFTGFVRPMMSQVRIPDMKSFQEAIKAWKAKAAKAPTSQPGKGTKAKAKKPPMPKMRWKAVGMRGFMAGNVTTILFLAPTQKSKKTPQVQWRKRRMDMEFSWYNAETGTFLKKQVFRQVLSLALVASKKKAHIAKVVIKDHPVHTAYDVVLPRRFAPTTSKSAWRAKDWVLVVKPPKGPKQRLTALLDERGYVARFRPDMPGFWSFHLLHKGKRLKGNWGYDGVVKAVPGRHPMPLLRHPKMPKRFLAGVLPRLGPVLIFAKPIPALLSNWSDAQAMATIKQLKRKSPGQNLVIAKLPKLPWKGFDQPLPKAKPTPTKPKPSKPKKGAKGKSGTKMALKALLHATGALAKAIPKAQKAKSAAAKPKAPRPSINPLALSNSTGPTAEQRLAFLQAVMRLERRIAALHKANRLLAITLSPAEWMGLPPQRRQARLFYLLDRFATAYPLLWLVDHRDGKSKPDGALTRIIKLWYMLRYPHPSFLRAATKGPKRPQKKKQVPPSAWPPLVGAAMGKLRSQQRLKQTKAYDFLWLELDNVAKDVKDFKLHRDPRPTLLTWKPLLRKDFQWRKASKGGKAKWNQKQLKIWARFLWRAQLLGFSHAGQPLKVPFVAPLNLSGKTKAKKTKKGKEEPPLTIAELMPPERIPAVMQAFFQTFDWRQLTPPIRSMALKDYQAFGAETPYGPKGKAKQHHAVIWVNQTVRKELLLTQKMSLKKHRYLWINPMNGQQPVSPQLLPLPPKGKPNKLQVPFRPALLYVFRRPPRKKQQKQKRRKKQKQNPRTSKRQRVRNKLKNLKDDRNRMFKKRGIKRLSGKRG